MAAMTVDRTAGITVGLDQLPQALVQLRGRLLALAEGLAPNRWAGPSRCHRWTVHEVLRHVRDACRLHVTGLQRDPFWPFDKPFDSRATPDEWLSLSEAETAEQTLLDLRRWSAAEAPAMFERRAPGDQDIVGGPYGPLPWTMLSLHVLWDGWLHERDVAQVTGGGLPSTPVEDAAVAAYALFIASMAASLMGTSVDMTVALTGVGGQYLAAVGPGHVELHTVGSSVTADFHGTLDDVVDSLSGRGSPLADVLAGDAAAREPLTWVGARLAPAAAS